MNPTWRTIHAAIASSLATARSRIPRTVLVRFIISDIKPESCEFEQSFSTMAVAYLG
jgi:hypothetical protein